MKKQDVVIVILILILVSFLPGMLFSQRAISENDTLHWVPIVMVGKNMQFHNTVGDCYLKWQGKLSDLPRFGKSFNVRLTDRQGIPLYIIDSGGDCTAYISAQFGFERRMHYRPTETKFLRTKTPQEIFWKKEFDILMKKLYI